MVEEVLREVHTEGVTPVREGGDVRTPGTEDRSTGLCETTGLNIRTPGTEGVGAGSRYRLVVVPGSSLRSFRDHFQVP